MLTVHDVGATTPDRHVLAIFVRRPFQFAALTVVCAPRDGRVRLVLGLGEAARPTVGGTSGVVRCAPVWAADFPDLDAALREVEELSQLLPSAGWELAREDDDEI